MNLKEIFNTWYEPLKQFLNSQEFIKIGRQVNQDRKNYTIIPEYNSNLLFKVFRETNYDSLKVVILGMDPYHTDNGAYDGLAFSNSTLGKAQPSLINILKEVESDVYNGLNLERMSNYSLYDWASQGVLLINTAMSVRQGSPDSHTVLWKPFTLAVIKAICEKNDIVWLLFGRKAINYKPLIKNPSHYIICTSHPSPYSVTSPVGIYPPFNNSKCFSQVNNQLTGINKSPIIW